MRARRGTRTGVALLAALAVLLGVGVVGVLRRHHAPAPASCRVAAAGGGYELDLEQAANAATIAAVGSRSGMPNHAVTVALATALQESKLRNLPYGDRDSLGLFQQRPSQGWGRPTQLLTPAYAAARFYAELRQVPGWRVLSVSSAAQRVQRSADGSAYERWADQARALARALTGEVPAGIACRFADPAAPQALRLESAARAELGPGRLGGATTSPARGWSTAAWLVSHGAEYGVVEVSVRGQRWTSAGGRWQVSRAAPAGLRYRLAGSRAA